MLLFLSIYNLIIKEECHLKNQPLIIKKRGEDGSKVISIRIKEDLLKEIDEIAIQSNYSRNELINAILSYGIKNIQIE